MIFHDLKTIFIHVERTGGVSLRKHLLQYENNFERWKVTKHFSAKKTRELIGDDRIWNLYTKIAFVRNPYDRLVSWYNACRQHPEWNSSIANYFQGLNCFDDIFKNPHPQLLISQADIVSGVDFVYKFENYENEVKMISLCLNIPYTKIKENISKHKHYRSYYNFFTRATMKKWSKKDLDYFGYEF